MTRTVNIQAGCQRSEVKSRHALSPALSRRERGSDDGKMNARTGQATAVRALACVRAANVISAAISVIRGRRRIRDLTEIASGGHGSGPRCSLLNAHGSMLPGPRYPHRLVQEPPARRVPRFDQGSTKVRPRFDQGPTKVRPRSDQGPIKVYSRFDPR